MNVGKLLTKAARTLPGNLAVAHGPRRLTYAQFDARVSRLANALARLGIGQGDHVALLQYNYPEILESMFACFKAGCAVVPINFRLHSGEYAFIKDMIISGGENIYPREIEEVIIRHPDVREVAVVAVPDPKWGEAVKAIVVATPGTILTEEAVIAWCQDAIASYKKPKAVECVAELPKNNYGKVLKRELRARYWQGRDRLV
jgi:acyl-CoA synthetase (AMP-forming)/AMP-acid ligase II